MSPTNLIAYIKLAFATAILVFVTIKLFVDWNIQHGAAAIAVWAVVNEVLSTVQARRTADDKDVKQLEKKIDETIS